MSEPRKIGLMELIKSSTGSQFVIPVYQRNYTWKKDIQVKQYFDDLGCVLKGEYKNHFLGILIYLEKTIDFSTREFSVIDGQQRLTTTFLTLYAVREMFKNSGDDENVKQLDGECLTNPFQKNINYKYKLKPLVSDDNVYRCIVEDRFDDIKEEEKESLIYKNYNYIKEYLKKVIDQGYTLNEIMLAMDKLYVVCVPISEEDNAQKIFESINATGIKLTSADLIRNFLLMNLDSENQDKFYNNYWKKIEEYISSDSNDLALFFRMYLAIKTYNLPSKNDVYRNFVEWVKNTNLGIEELFKNLLLYTKLYNDVKNVPIDTLDKLLQVPITDYRKIKSDLPNTMIIEFYRLYKEDKITAEILGQLIQTVNSYIIRRSICDMNSNNISRLFPDILKLILVKCDGDYKNILNELTNELVAKLVKTSGSYMPTDEQMYDSLIRANVYSRPALRIVLERIELTNNPAPVDLSKLSIEHLMPQKPTDEWFQELDIDEENYIANLNRLGNLTLAAKSDNSKMSNNVWEYKNKILQNTAHIKMNEELKLIDKWNIENIHKRTENLIKRICELYPYPLIDISTKEEIGTLNDKVSRQMTIAHMLSDAEEISKNKIYTRENNTKGYILLTSRLYPESDGEKYWFSIRYNHFDSIEDCKEKYFILICRRSNNIMVINLPYDFFEKIKDNLHCSKDDEIIRKYHIKIHNNNGKISLLLTKPKPKKIDISQFVVAELV